jgi:hypothetical protein
VRPPPPPVDWETRHRVVSGSLWAAACEVFGDVFVGEERDVTGLGEAPAAWFVLAVLVGVVVGVMLGFLVA